MSEVNTSGLLPLGRAVLIRTYEPERRGSLIEVPDFVTERGAAVEVRAVVVAIGPSCWPDETARAKPGDKVLITKMAGFVAKGTKDGKVYRFINDRDIFARIEEEN
jgi:co-chaperonin GroES (HSP10)